MNQITEDGGGQEEKEERERERLPKLSVCETVPDRDVPYLNRAASQDEINHLQI